MSDDEIFERYGEPIGTVLDWYESGIKATETYRKMNTKEKDNMAALFYAARYESEGVPQAGNVARTMFVIGAHMGRAGELIDIEVSVKNSRDALVGNRELEAGVRRMIVKFLVSTATDLWGRPEFSECKIMKMSEALSKDHLSGFLSGLRNQARLPGSPVPRGPLGLPKDKKGKRERELNETAMFGGDSLSPDTIAAYLRKTDKIEPFIPEHATRGGGKPQKPTSQK